MLTFIGIVLILLAIGSYVWGKVIKSNKEFNADLAAKYPDDPRTVREYSKTESPLPVNINSTMWGIIGILVIMINGLFFWADAGTAYAVQYPWGGDKMIATQGFKVKAWGRTIPLSYETSIKDNILKGDQELSKNSDGIYNRVAQEWEFSDAIKADIAVAVIVGVSIDDEEKFLLMADRNKSEAKLIYGRVLPNIDAAIKNTCKLMDAQEYISGKASDFDRYFKDQLDNGMYLVEEYFEAEDVPEIIGDTTTIRKIVGKSSKQKRYKIMRDNQGNIMRDKTSNSLRQYGLTIHQAKVTSIDWEDSFDERLDLQKDEVAKTQLEKQEAERQFYTTKKEIAKGEAEKAKERALLEKEQIKLTIAAETEAKVAEQNLIAEKKIYDVSIYQAKSIKVIADANAYKNTKLYAAGLTPQERRAMDEQMNRDKWQNIGKMKFDGVYMMDGGKGKGSDGLLSALLGAEVAKGMLLKPTK
jgi:regulator of protease activity HflC (stomatin/prohibitin superfamily)